MWRADKARHASRRAEKSDIRLDDRIRDGLMRAFCFATEPAARPKSTKFPVGQEFLRRPRRAGAPARPLQTQIEFADQFVVVEGCSGFPLEGDLAVDDHIAAIGDADRLVEVLL